MNIGVVGPSWRQTKLIIKHINNFLQKLPKTAYKKPQKTAVALFNNSNIEAYPNNPETIRGPKLHIVYCLPSHVEVSLSDRTKIPICELKTGQEILSYNARTGQVEPKRVLRIFRNPRAGREIIRLTHLFGHLDCTIEHKIFTSNRGYVPASQLSKGDKILYLADITNYSVGTTNEVALQSTSNGKSRTINLWRTSGRPLHTKAQEPEKERSSCNKSLLKTSRVRSIQILNSEKSCETAPQRSTEQGLGKIPIEIQHANASRDYEDIPNMLSKWAKDHHLRMARKNQHSICIGNVVYGRWEPFEIIRTIQHTQIFQKRTRSPSTMATESLEHKRKNSEGRQRQRIFPATFGERQGFVLRSNQTTYPHFNAIQNLAKTRTCSMHNMRQARYSEKSSFVSEKESCLLKYRLQKTLGKNEQRLETKTTKTVCALREELHPDTGQNMYVFSRLSDSMEASAEKASKIEKQKTAADTALPSVWQSICAEERAPENLQYKMPQSKTQEILESSLISEALPILRNSFSSSDGETEILQCKMSRETQLFHEEEQAIVYDIEVEDNHNFFADGVLVSNCDEFNFIANDEELYDAMLFTLGTTNGKFICTSTPWRSDSIFHKIFHNPTYADYAKTHVTWQQALEPNGPLKQQILNRIRHQLEGDPARWQREMEAEWAENENVWLPQALITSCIDHTLEYAPFEETQGGDFYAGLDLGKTQDHSVLAIAKAENTGLKLVHMHQFPLNTPYASVIGYVKTITDRWQTTHKILVDQTGIGDYITEDMQNAGITQTEGVKFTQETKQEMAQWLKTTMTEKRLHIPYDSQLIPELNLERYELTKEGKTKFNHPQATHDDRFWALALATTAARTEPTPRFWVINKHAGKTKLNAPRQKLQQHRTEGTTR